VEIYRTEEQQLDALRQGWKKNQKWILSVVGVTLACVLGFKFFQHHQESERYLASEKYSLLLKSHEENDLTTQKQKADELMSQYARSSYATLAAFMQAKAAVEEKKFDEAEKHLIFAQKQASVQELKSIATVRLARLYLAQEKWDDVEKVLKQASNSGYLTLLEEVKGDYYFFKQDLMKARQAYLAALDNDPTKGEKRPILRMKLEEIDLKK
jgi:predicted negative regulator of RcsB-dependent stress response